VPTRKGAGRSHFISPMVAANEGALDSTAAELLATPPVRTFVRRQIDDRRAGPEVLLSWILNFYWICRRPGPPKAVQILRNFSRLDRSMVRLLALLARPYEPSPRPRESATFRASTSCRTVPSACPRSSLGEAFPQAST